MRNFTSYIHDTRHSFESIQTAAEWVEGLSGQTLLDLGVVSKKDSSGVWVESEIPVEGQAYVVTVLHPVLDKSLQEEYVLVVGENNGEPEHNDDSEAGPGDEEGLDEADPGFGSTDEGYSVQGF